MANKQEVARINRNLEEQLEHSQRELAKARSQLPVPEVKPMFFDKLSHGMDLYSKRRLIEYCKVELSHVFDNMPSNKRSMSAGTWEATLNTFFDRVEQFIYNDSGKEWRVRRVGSFAFRSYNPLKMDERDVFRITFGHPALKQNRINPHNQVETPTPTPVIAQMTVTIKNFEAVNRV